MPFTPDATAMINSRDVMANRSITVIEPKWGWAPLNFHELWEYREFLYFLVWRDLKVRYKQTVLGVGWAVIQPVAMMVIFTFVFGQVAGISTGTVPYPVFIYAALLPWGLFSTALSQGGTSISRNGTLVTRVYFPRLLLPAATVISGLVDFAISLLVLAGLMVYYGIMPTAAILTLPLFTVLAALSGLAVALFLAPLEVKYRDIRYIVPFLTQIWLFATPIAYPITSVPSSLRWVFSLNPLVSVVEGFQWAITGVGATLDPLATLSLAATFVLLIFGLFYFRRTEKAFADVM